VGGADVAQERRGSHPARQRDRGRRPWLASARRSSRPHDVVTRHAKRGERWEKEGADRRAPHGSIQEERLVVDGSAGYVGPKGQAAWLSCRAGVKGEGLADLY
jgi:hypothetical protein